MVAAAAASPRSRWGTWEDLVLGGAVLRHGTQAWEAVASELQARTLYPFSFTPEACKARYEDLQRRYSGCRAWFEELRKRRVAELRRELEKSEDSIGSLESKLENLKSAKGDRTHISYGSSFTDSPVPVLKTEGVESSGKDTSKDGLSAGSFTQDIRANRTTESQIPASAAEMDIKVEISESSEPVKASSFKNLDETTQTSNEQGGTLRKRRGSRKRKDCNREPKEWSVGEVENFGSTNVVSPSYGKENSTSDCGRMIRSPSINNHDRRFCRAGNDDLMGIFNFVAENENALAFRHRLDSQKRARYRNIIRQHMDFNSIRARIMSCSIVSVKELFRDLLLLVNNALVFYSKRTREYKTAVLLRDVITKAYRHHQHQDSSIRVASPIFPLSPMCNPPVKPRSVRLHKRKLPAKPPDAEDAIVGTLETSKHRTDTENVASGTSEVRRKPTSTGFGPSMDSLMMGRKSFSRAGKVVRPPPSQQRVKTPVKERKRARRR